MKLAGVMLVVAAAPAYFVWTLKGANGLLALLLAAVVCWSGAALALTSSVILQPQRPLAVTLLGMALRMGFPLVGVIVVTLHQGPLAEGGFVGCILFYYIVTLIAETWLSLKLIPSHERLEAR